jgi:hypothetical protein
VFNSLYNLLDQLDWSSSKEMRKNRNYTQLNMLLPKEFNRRSYSLKRHEQPSLLEKYSEGSSVGHESPSGRDHSETKTSESKWFAQTDERNRDSICVPSMAPYKRRHRVNLLDRFREESLDSFWIPGEDHRAHHYLESEPVNDKVANQTKPEKQSPKGEVEIKEIVIETIEEVELWDSVCFDNVKRYKK